MRDYVQFWMSSGGYISTGSPSTLFFNSKEAADLFLQATPDFNPATWNNFVWVILNKINLQSILNFAYNSQTTVPSDAPHSILVSLPPRDSGCNSVAERDPKYSGNVAEAKPGPATKGSATFVLSLGAYLELIYEQLLAKGAIAHANLVRAILDDWTAQKIDDAEALTRLQEVSNLL